ncbi:hypothetical protein ACF065_13370 [Streptomyces sp. NPDC015232]|uniref:hypothetical protein n=1 Tax=unclassified Streptomyces TaxID=2593676 RepID=UPI0036F4D29F
MRDNETPAPEPAATGLSTDDIARRGGDRETESGRPPQYPGEATGTTEPDRSEDADRAAGQGGLNLPHDPGPARPDPAEQPEQTQRTEQPERAERTEQPEQTGQTGQTDRTAGDTAAVPSGGARQGTPDEVAAGAERSADEPPRLMDPGDEETFRTRWHELQSLFVDDPRRAVHEADALVADVMQKLATTFSDHRTSLEAQWRQGEEADTESLRTALRRYRSFFHRLLRTGFEQDAEESGTAPPTGPGGAAAGSGTAGPGGQQRAFG